jgi:sulfate adenylyltransferase subunit 1
VKTVKDCLRVVVTGDVDSGKSTLIGRFLYEMGLVSREAIAEIKNICQRQGNDFEFAYLLDSLEEERNNQLTIDTTQAFCKTKKGKEFVFIDVPGHQELLKNMLSGSSYADIAILVVSAQESIKEQTKRHAFILKFLGIEQVITVLNKMDLLGFNKIVFKETREEISRLFNKIQVQPNYCVPISAKQGDNLVRDSEQMPWYKGPTILEALNTCFKRRNKGNFYFPIQDVYRLGNKNVAVGRIISGAIKRKEKVEILPLNELRRVETIEVFNKSLSEAKAPENIGLILDKMDGLTRGQVICKAKIPKLSKEILAKIFCVRPLDIKQSLRFRCTTQETFAQIKQIKGVWDIANLERKARKDILKETDLAEVVIVSENPVVVERFVESNDLGRFVLQNNNEICAIGIIL